MLPRDLKVALLQSLEVIDAVVGQEVQTELNAFDLFDDKLNDLQWVSLLMNLLNNFWLFNENRVDKLDQFVLEGEPFLAQLTVEHARIVDV